MWRAACSFARRVLSRAVRIGGLLTLVAARAGAEPHDDVDASAQAPESSTDSSDDLIVAPGVRPITGARLEALVGAGAYARRIAAARATDRLGPVDVELTGGSDDSSGYTLARSAVATASDARHGAAVRVEGDGATAFARWSELHRDAGAPLETRDEREFAVGGRWTLRGEPGRADFELYGARDDVRGSLADGTFALPGQTYGARTHLRARTVHAFGLAHELGVDAGVL